MNVGKPMPNDFDFIVELFFKNFLGKSRLLDGAVELISDSYTLGSVLFVALLWLAWFKDKRDNSRIRLLKGGVGVLLAGLLSRALQFVLAFHYRPLYNSDLRLPWPIGVAPGTLNHWNSFPSDHAALFFALATLIWVGDRRLGVFAYAWATIESFTRVYLGYHYPSDVFGGAGLGISMVILSQWLPLRAVANRLLDWERGGSAAFYAVAFVASYEASTFFTDVRAIAQLIGQIL
jgi:membrane-associated phospholipid phosphatase